MVIVMMRVVVAVTVYRAMTDQALHTRIVSYVHSAPATMWGFFLKGKLSIREINEHTRQEVTVLGSRSP